MRKAKSKQGSGKSVTITTQDMMYAGLGVVAAMAVNPLVNKVLEGQEESIRNTVGTAFPVVKVAAGGYLAMQSQVDRMYRWFGVGVATEGTAELALKYIPENYVSIKGVDGDIFSMLGNSSVIEIPINASRPSMLAANAAFDDQGILGTEDLYASQMAQDMMI